MVMMAALKVKLAHWSAPEPGDCASSIYGYRTICNTDLSAESKSLWWWQQVSALVAASASLSAACLTAACLGAACLVRLCAVSMAMATLI